MNNDVTTLHKDHIAENYPQNIDDIFADTLDYSKAVSAIIELVGKIITQGCGNLHRGSEFNVYIPIRYLYVLTIKNVFGNSVQKYIEITHAKLHFETEDGIFPRHDECPRCGGKRVSCEKEHWMYHN